MIAAAPPATNNFLGDAMRGRPIRAGGYGTLSRSYRYAADLAMWLWAMLVKARPRGPLNIGSLRSLSSADLAGEVGAALKPSLALEIAKRPTAGQPPSPRVPSNARALQELAIAEHVDLTTVARRTAQHATR